MTDPIPTAPELQPDALPLHSNAWRLQGVLLEPEATFQEIGKRPNWILPLMMLTLVALLANSLLIQMVGLENILRQQFAQSAQVRQLAKDQREQILQSQLESPITKAFSYGAAVLAFLPMLATAGALLLLLLLMGARGISFRKVFSVTCHSFFAYTLITSALLLLVVFLKEDRGGVDLQNALQSNLGFLVNRKDSPALFSLLSSIDLFVAYNIFLLSLGLSSVGRKLSRESSLGVVLFAWAVYLAGKVGLTALFS